MGSQIRLDRYLSEMGMGSRSEVKKNIGYGKVTVNGKIVRKPETKIIPGTDEVIYKKTVVEYKENVYFMLNKPAGILSATTDVKQKTVIDLFEGEHRKNLFCVGRLDKDVTGLLIVTDDGDFSHRLMSPKNKIPKVYKVLAEGILDEKDKEVLEKGIPLDGDFVTSPAHLKVEKVFEEEERTLCYLTIYEGKFHQVKRMFEYIHKPVVSLKRIKIGGVELDSKLKAGEYRELTKEEKESIFKKDTPDISSGKVGGVIFDMDGTLIDSMWLWMEIDVEFLGRYGIPYVEGLQQKIEGKSFKETANYFKEEFKIPETIEYMMDEWNRMAYDKYYNEVFLKEGVYEFLLKLKKENIPIGIATSNSRVLVRTVLERLNVIDFFDAIVTADEVENGKPAPDVYLAGAEAIGVNPKDCFVFEDILKGVMAGKAAGMTVCAVYDEYAAFVDEMRDLSDYYIQSFTELLP